MKVCHFICRIAPLFLAIVTTATAQVVTLSGIVRDKNSHREIRAASVTIKGTRLGTYSDANGRYSLPLPSFNPESIVIFRHVGYELREIPLDSLLQMKQVYLQPRVIPLPGIEVEAQGVERPDIARDLPQAMAVIEAQNFEIRGYVDAGDLLKTEQSVQVQEELSGKKTAGIRGGNSDEVVVMYNGVKMNNAFNNIFDFSLIDLEDIESFQIIKGSNTALYGPEAFSGVINIVPKMQQDYNLRFQQRLGTYRSGNWGAHLYQKLDRLQGSFSIKRGATQRNYIDTTAAAGRVENASQHYTASLNYNLTKNAEKEPGNSLGAMYIQTGLDYDNRRLNETVANLNQVASLKYTGAIGGLKNLDLMVSMGRLDENQDSHNDTTSIDRHLDDRSVHVNVEKRQSLGRFEVLLAYQFQRDEMDFLDLRYKAAFTGMLKPDSSGGLQSGVLHRQHHGFVAITKLHGEGGAKVFQGVDFDLSLRHDRVRDGIRNAIFRPNRDPSQPMDDGGLLDGNRWNETKVKFSINLSGSRKDLAWSSFLNFGSNVKFPTLFQQVSVKDTVRNVRFQPNLSPETNHGLEVGVTASREIRGHPSLYGWQVGGNYFQNQYSNKFRVFSSPFGGSARYDNVMDARISGLEGKSSLFFYRKKITLEVGFSRYYISDKAAFPFKSDSKRVLNLYVDHGGYSFQLHWFKEGEQVVLLRQNRTVNQESGFAEVTLPAYSNLDVHCSKTFAIGRLKLFTNASGRNLLNAKDVVLEGLAFRDRRYYLTIGAQY